MREVHEYACCSVVTLARATTSTRTARACTHPRSKKSLPSLSGASASSERHVRHTAASAARTVVAEIGMLRIGAEGRDRAPSRREAETRGALGRAVHSYTHAADSAYDSYTRCMVELRMYVDDRWRRCVGARDGTIGCRHSSRRGASRHRHLVCAYERAQAICTRSRALA
jgi:hypothetical protein